jgi:UNC80 N-terminal/Protein UNC80
LPHLRPSDFTSFRLENGLKIWQPLWEYRQPDIPCFNAPAKPTPSITDTQTELEQQQLQVSGLNVGDIYVGVQQDEGFLLAEPERNVEEAAAATEALQRARAAPHMTAPLAHMSEICTLTTLDTPLTLTPNLEYFCELCNSKVQADAKNVLRCKCGHHRRPRSSGQQISGLFSSATSALAQQASLAASVFFNGAAAVEPLAQSNASAQGQHSPVDKEFLHNKMEMSILSDGGRAQSLRDVSAATLFDVAVLRCLHVPPWSEEGLFWAVRYFLNRLIEIRDYLQRTGGIRQRSNSVPSSIKQQEHLEEAAGLVKSSSTSRPVNKLTPTSRREHLLSPLERGGSKRRRLAQASNSLDDAYKPKFFLGGEKLSSGRNDNDISPGNSPGPNRLQDVMFTFGDEERLMASPTLSRTGPTSNPVTPRERNMMRRSGQSSFFFLFPKSSVLVICHSYLSLLSFRQKFPTNNHHNGE